MTPIRILHVVGAMNRGGAETWLLQLLRRIDRERFRLDFLVHDESPGAYDEEVRAFGSRIIRCTAPRAPLSYARRLQSAIAEQGPYDVVHSHVHFYSGWVLRSARRAGVPVRIAHSHCGAASVEARPGAWHPTYRRIMRHMIRRHATHGLAASSEAAAALWGENWRDDPRWHILHCGLDLAPYAEPTDRERVRRELGIPPEARVIGHVGSFTPAKNHRFLMEISAEAIRRDATVRILLVGDGPLRGDMEERAARLGIAGSVIFAGIRRDVPRIMTGAVDAFVFPSLFEGLPLAVLEAQAAGLPVILSDSVTREVAVVPALISWLSLSSPASSWAARCLEAAGTPDGVARSRALRAVAGSPFRLEANVAALAELYARPSAGSAPADRRAAGHRE